MTLFRRLRELFRKNKTGLELDDELRFHLQRMTEKNVAAGMSPEEACYAALREFGGVEQIKEECRSARGLDFVESVFQDLRYAVRNFRRTPSFALTAVAVAALGIGATTAVFSVVDRIVFRELPYAHADRLVSLGIVAPIFDFDFLTATNYIDLRRDPGPLEAVTSWAGVVNCDLTENQPLRLACAPVENTFLPLLGIQPALGRNFTAEEDRPGVPGVALISHTLWTSRFAARPGAVGERISLDGQPMLIIGVLPPQFELPTLDKVDLLVPRRLPPNPRPGGIPSRVYGRMKPGVTLAQVQSMDSLVQRVLSEAPPQYHKEIRLRVRTLQDLRSGGVRAASWTLLAGVLAVLLIACANVASLMLARSTLRQRELSIRVALGAGRARIARQTLTEALLLSLAAGAAGCLLAAGLLRLFQWIAPAGIPHLAYAALDVRVLLFALLISILCGIAFGVAPAFQTPRPQHLGGTRTTASPSSLRARHILVGAQLAVSLVLLTSAGLLLQSLWQRLSVSLGIRTDRIVTAQISVGIRYPQPAARLAFLEQLEQRLERLPGVETVALSDSLPPGGVPRTQPFFAIRPEGQPPHFEGIGGIVVWRHITPGYFRALGIPILRGRPYTEEDRAPNANTIIISQALAAKLFPGQDALGRRLRRFSDSPWLTVVGIAADARNAGLADRNDPEYYAIRRHDPADAVGSNSIIVRAAARPQAVESWIRTEIAALDNALPAVIRVFDDQVGELAARPRFQALLLALFAGVGLTLAASGLYGLIAYLAAQRRREIGIRLALGATPTQVTRMMLGHALRWTAGGLTAGLAGSAVAAWSLRSLLFRVSAADPVAFGASAALLTGLAVLAALAPSRRAAALDPMDTLRED